MAQGGPVSGGGANYGAAHARIDLDLSSLTGAAQVARASGDVTAKALEQMFQTVQNEQKLALQQAQQATAAVRAQQAQITATARAESAERIAAARSEASVVQQQARAETATIIEEQRRQTAQFKQELKDRNQAQRQSQVSAGAFARGAASFVGAAVGGPIGGLVGAATMGNPELAAGLVVNQVASSAVQASQVAVAYNRQEIAARSLAGGQGKLNDLMVAYDRATGGAVDKATELAKVTALEATGFAKNAKDLQEFATGVRGAALAMGKTQDEITQETQLAIVNQSKRRLDQIGLGVDEVTQRINELTKADKSLSAQQAFSQAVIGLQNEKFGALAKSSEGAASGLERLAKAQKDLQLQAGQATKGPVNSTAGFFAMGLENIANAIGPFQRKFQHSIDAAKYGYPIVPGAFQIADSLQFSRDSQGRDQSRHTPGRASVPVDRFTDTQQDALLDWNKKRIAIERETQSAVASEARSWANARLDAERSFTKQSVREGQDWARQQSRTFEDFQEGQAKNARDYAKSREREERDLGRSVAQAQADEAEKVAGIRIDGNKQLQKIEESFAADQAKAARHFKTDQMDAAGDLDAKAIAKLQRDYREQQQDAKEAHDQQVKDNKEQLQERLDDESKSLAKSIEQQRTALSQREADQAEDYAQSNADAIAQFGKEQARATEDRATRIDRMVEDHNDQMDAIDRSHKAALDDIAQRSNDQKEAIKEVLTNAGIAVKGFVDVSVDDSIKAYDKFFGHVQDLANGKVKPGDPMATGIPKTPASPAGYANGGYIPHDMVAYVHRGEYVTPAANVARGQFGPGGASMGNLSINIYPTPNHSPTDIAKAVRTEVTEIFRELAA